MTENGLWKNQLYDDPERRTREIGAILRYIEMML